MSVSTLHEPLDVLIVEDCSDSARCLAFLVQAWGHVPRIASTGQEALRQAFAAVPDVVLLDIGLPGLDGWEVARRLRATEWGGRPLLIAMSGYGPDEDKEASWRAGCHMHLTKPVDPELLHQILEHKHRGDEA